MWSGYGYGHGFGWGMGFGMIGVVLFWAPVIIAIAALVKWIVGGFGSGRQTPGKTALDLLKERYARGEIGPEEFEQKRRDIAT